ncbi:hypothetical protein TNCV_3378521 [Trichonephila clavipes]|nr:hypothetical protein TNCV_3378521 [Trichonephila clavipes]
MGSRSRHPDEKDSSNSKQDTPRHDERTLLHCTASFTLGSEVISHSLDSQPSAVPSSFLRSSPSPAGALLR